MMRPTFTSFRAFTLVELCLGLIVVAMVMSALAAFALAVSNCWKYSDASQGSAITGSRAVARLQRRLHDAKRIGYYRTSPPALVYWTDDANADGRMQFSELAMVALNPDTHNLELCQPKLGSGESDEVVTYNEFMDAAVASRFEGHSTKTPLLGHVASVAIDVQHPNDAAMAPTVQVMLTFSPASPAQAGTTELVTATLRGPAPAQ
jgi:hypothetical protein